MIQNEYYITFSFDTVKILANHKIAFKKISDDNKARKRGWYFLKSDIEEKFPEFFIFIENARKYRQQYNRKKKEKQKKKVKPRKPRIPNDKLHRDSVDKKWRRIAKESIPISP